MLPVEFAGDGSGATLPLAWARVPEGTASFAVIMHHVDPQGKTKWYWVLYNIPADVRSLPKNVSAVGVLGNNSVNGRAEYAPPHSKGPGEKTYIYTIYALSAPPQLSVVPAQVSRDVLLSAIKGSILGRAELKVVYTRRGDIGSAGDRGTQPPPPPIPTNSY
ncbi:MAG: YbhB/YbcL family Raf kinase inhibitor-like protein [Verrucomicrobiae bacterium]